MSPQLPPPELFRIAFSFLSSHFVTSTMFSFYHCQNAALSMGFPPESRYHCQTAWIYHNKKKKRFCYQRIRGSDPIGGVKVMG
jgi:hypothetical protein